MQGNTYSNFVAKFMRTDNGFNNFDEFYSQFMKSKPKFNVVLTEENYMELLREDDVIRDYYSVLDGYTIYVRRTTSVTKDYKKGNKIFMVDSDKERMIKIEISAEAIDKKVIVLLYGAQNISDILDQARDRVLGKYLLNTREDMMYYSDSIQEQIMKKGPKLTLIKQKNSH